jgi:hypothetical protein
MRKGLLHRAVSESAQGLGLTRITMKPVMVNGRRIFLSHDDEALSRHKLLRHEAAQRRPLWSFVCWCLCGAIIGQHTTRPLPRITGLI